MSDIDEQQDGSEAAISRAAAEWFARLLEDASPATHKEFRQWLLEDERHARAYADFERLWAGAGLAPELDRSTSLSRRNLLRGGVAVLALGAGYSGFRLWSEAGDYTTTTGETAEFRLPDGSRAQLSPQTTLSLDFSTARRRVLLSRGEAYFAVASDRARPFTVEAGGLSVTALGTEFSFAHEQDGVSVLVTKHAVEAAANGERQYLAEGQGLSFRQGKLTSPAEADIEAKLAWRSGRLVFISTPLGKVVEDIGRWRSGRIVIMDAALARRPVTLILDVKRSDRILETLEFGLSVRITQISPWLALVYAR